jgi:hypothetical protein
MLAAHQGSEEAGDGQGQDGQEQRWALQVLNYILQCVDAGTFKIVLDPDLTPQLA